MAIVIILVAFMSFFCGYLAGFLSVAAMIKKEVDGDFVRQNRGEEES